ncbi:Dyp-type peroxidase [Sphingomonas nostoxanthinifaciens]|uniref:Dyp-type peroxidase n=1 Tax=Sphingomonas nostoxanthinifaciens TaxID=2872652 RepID=UPI001CC1C2C2|nr:Dyp-type peroxidase [Sphingomonas nostoxanthinifaciens]UAK24779.1 Dyp-type peroxidase [Sphingomonas nostoxanthinifaciens]
MGQQIFLDPPDPQINERNIQGDILIGLQKKAEIFLMFEIVDVSGFKAALETLIPRIATLDVTRKYEEAAAKVSSAKHACCDVPPPPDLDTVVKTNIAFSAIGLAELGMLYDGADPSFIDGMENLSEMLGDDTTEWLPEYLDRQIDGVLLVAAWDADIDQAETMALDAAGEVLGLFGASLTVIAQEVGSLNRVAPGHEMFGFADGVSQPGVKGLHKPIAADDQGFPGQDLVELGDFLLGPYESELGTASTPPQPWMQDGSYMVFRRLQQDVKAFRDYTRAEFSGLAPSPEAFAAKLIGRWKDGSPLARDPMRPNPAHDGDHPLENNDFEFGVEKVAQTRCPFNAHIRRVYPRSDIQAGVGNAEQRRILRAGISYDNSDVEFGDRGLLFVCYQSSIVDKFDFIQTSWANATSIPFVPPYTGIGVLPPNPGIDLIIGQAPVRSATWDGGGVLNNVPRFVTSSGGEYFFMPSLSGLRALAS